MTKKDIDAVILTVQKLQIKEARISGRHPLSLKDALNHPFFRATAEAAILALKRRGWRPRNRRSKKTL